MKRFRHRRHRESGHNIDNSRQFIRSFTGNIYKTRYNFRCRWQKKRATIAFAKLMKLVLEFCHHSKIAAPTSYRPKKLRVVTVVDLEDFASSCYYLSAQLIVDSQAEFSRQVANSSAQSNTSDTD